MVHLAELHERAQWDSTGERYHYLGFKRFAGRGLRYIVEWCGLWTAMAGWQAGAFKSRHRDRWIGWSAELQFQCLHLIANNTRFVILGAKGVFPCLASFAMTAMLRRLGDDWQSCYGHPILIAETFVNPALFEGTIYEAANWHCPATPRALPAITAATPTPTASPSGSMSIPCAATPACPDGRQNAVGRLVSAKTPALT